MGNDKAVRPLIEVLQATEMGGREGVNERTKEWENRVDEEGEVELDDQYICTTRRKSQEGVRAQKPKAERRQRREEA